MMKVLVACHGLWPMTPVGGMERETFNLCRDLVKNGVEAVCAVPQTQLTGKEPFPTLGLVWPKVKPWLLANHLFSAQVVNHLRQNSYDVALSMGFALASWSAKEKTPLIFHGEGLNSLQTTSPDPRLLWMRHITKKLTRYAQATIAESPRMAQLAQKRLDTTPGKIKTIFPGVEMPRKPDITSTRPIDILFVGRFSHEKGITDFVEISQRLIKNHPGLRVTLIGRGPLEDTLRTQLPSSNVEIVPPVKPEVLMSYYLRSKILLISSHSEGIPQVALEAMGCGTLLVVSLVGGLPDLVDEETVKGFNRGDFALATEKVESILTMGHDDTVRLREKLVLRANREFSAECFTQNYISLFKSFTS